MPPLGHTSSSSVPSLRRLRERAHCGAQLGFVSIAPADLLVSEKVAAADGEKDVRVVDAGRNRAVLLERPGGAQQMPAGAGDHLVARTQMLEAVVDDGSHALGYRLV